MRRFEKRDISYTYKTFHKFINFMPFPVKTHFCPIRDPPQKLSSEPSFISILTIQGKAWGLGFCPENILNKISFYVHFNTDYTVLRTYKGRSFSPKIPVVPYRCRNNILARLLGNFSTRRCAVWEVIWGKCHSGEMLVGKRASLEP